nr:NADH dehydrogenase subunit 4 [Forskalia sp.]
MVLTFIYLILSKEKKKTSLIFQLILLIYFWHILDKLSLFFVMLSILLIITTYVYNWNNNNFSKEFIILLYLLSLILIGVFIVEDLIYFFILFEFALVPIFLLIGVLGSEGASKAAFYFFLYTFSGSVLMFASIVKIYSLTGSTNFFFLYYVNLPENLQFYFFLAFLLSLAVKTPMVPVHIWLPQAHVEAPMAGSVLLAGILLKLGGYGFLRFNLLFPAAVVHLAPYVILLSLISIVYGALTAVRQSDMKRLIAYSSVSHMGMATLAIFTNSYIGFVSSTYMMLAHGFTSASLFILVGLLYHRYNSRILKYYKGLTSCMPIFSIIFFIMTLANIGFPLTFNFKAELLVLCATINYCPIIVALLVGFSLVIGLLYSFYLFIRINFGSLGLLTTPRDLTLLEFYPLSILVLLVFFFGMNTF